MSAEKELIVAPPQENALAVYSAEKGLDPWLQKIRAKVDDFLSVVPDLKSVKGRKAITSMAYDIARTKTGLEDAGKAISAEQKKVSGRIDAERKRVWEILESWQKEVRKPLDDWQEAEDRRIDAIKADIERISDQAMNLDGVTAEDLEERIAKVEAVTIEGKWAEFQVDAALAKEKALTALYTALTNRKLYEADQAELAQRRADDEARAQREHDERIRKEAEERVQAEAIQKAAEEREAALQREHDARAEAEYREIQLKNQAARAEQAAEQAKADQEAAEQRADQERRDSAARAEQAAEDARQAEIKRQQDAADEIIRQQDLREADTAHRAKVNRKALEAFTANGMTEACAKQAITLIVQGKIPAITLTY